MTFLKLWGKYILGGIAVIVIGFLLFLASGWVLLELHKWLLQFGPNASVVVFAVVVFLVFTACLAYDKFKENKTYN